MISAQSHLLRSNGSKLFAFFLLSLFFFSSSCALFRKAETEDKAEEVGKEGDELDPIPGKKVYDPETGTLVIVDQTPVESMDTIKWKDIPADSIPPIRSESFFAEEEQMGNPSELIRRGEYGTEYYTAYNVGLILPFLTDRFNPNSGEIFDNSTWALNFYGGARMALEELDEQGVRLNVTVMDSKAEQRQVAQLTTRTEMLNAHLLIGPYRRDNVELLANFSKRNGITYVSPHSAASSISDNNPNYVQVSPTLESHSKAIIRHARESFRPAQAVLVARDKDAEKARFLYFQEENYTIEGTRNDSVRLRELIVGEDAESYQNMGLGAYFKENLSDTVVFIVPSWSSETFIYSFLSNIKASRGMEDYVRVYGMPQWMSFERIDFELYESLNVHVSSDSHLDPYNTDVQFFRKRFFDRYGAIPNNEAFLGYDVVKYFGDMIHKHGTKFQYFLEKEPRAVLHTRFDFERVVRPTTTGVENPPIERFENKYVNILKFEDYQFQLAY